MMQTIYHFNQSWSVFCLIEYCKTKSFLSLVMAESDFFCWIRWKINSGFFFSLHHKYSSQILRKNVGVCMYSYHRNTSNSCEYYQFVPWLIHFQSRFLTGWEKQHKFAHRLSPLALTWQILKKFLDWLCLYPCHCDHLLSKWNGWEISACLSVTLLNKYFLKS